MSSDQASRSTLENDIEIFRRFNRMYTRFLGTLNEALLESDYSLAEARVLYELATRTAPRAAEIADELEMDPGYLSRMLGKFERRILLKGRASEQDGRSTELILTARGRSAFKKLNALSDEQAKSIFRGLSSSARMELIRCMLAIEGVLRPVEKGRAPFVLRPH